MIIGAILAGSKLNLLTGTILLFVAYKFLTNSFLVVTADHVEVKTLLGTTVKNYPYEKLSLRDGKLYADEEIVKNMSLGIANKEDMRKLKESI